MNGERGRSYRSKTYEGFNDYLAEPVVVRRATG
jgi:hypothetical protein